ncbi:MAG: O-methyltransferase [Treponema sp.]|nr:O-methyltransferase [Treponema sp.]
MNELSDIKSFARKNQVPIMLEEGSDFICKYIREHDVKKVLEIGTAIGYSTIKFAEVRDDIYVTTIELDIDRHIAAKQNFSDSGLSDRINAVYADALLYQTDEKFDVIFIDAAKAQYVKLFQKYKENLSPDGVIISDNLSFHGMVDDMTLTHNDSTKKLVRKIRRYVDFLKNNPEFQTDFFEFGDRLSVSKKK